MKELRWLYVKQIWKARKDRDVRKATLSLLVWLTFMTAVLAIGYWFGMLYALIGMFFGENFAELFAPHTWWMGDPFLKSSLMRLLSLAYYLAIASIIIPTMNLCKAYIAVRLVASALDEADLMSADHGETIAEVIYNIRKEPVEFYALFDKNEQKVSETTVLSPNCTYISEEALERLHTTSDHGFTDIHNHPTVCSAFSPDDLASAIINHVSKMIVISVKMVYTIEIPDECWANLDKLEEDPTSEYADLCEQLSDPQAFQTICNTWSNKHLAVVSVAACKAFAKRYGFKFTAEEYKKSQYYKDYENLLWRRLWTSAKRDADTPAMACQAEPKIPTGFFGKLCFKFLIFMMKN